MAYARRAEAATDLSLNLHPFGTRALWVDAPIGAGGATVSRAEFSDRTAWLSIAVNILRRPACQAIGRSDPRLKPLPGSSHFAEGLIDTQPLEATLRGLRPGIGDADGPVKAARVRTVSQWKLAL